MTWASLLMIFAIFQFGHGIEDATQEEIEKCRNIALAIPPGYVPTVKRGVSI